MAYYNNYYPNYAYNGAYHQPQQGIQNGGFVTVQSEEEARSYPVGHGMSVTFRDENAPYIYTKTLGFGQFDSPAFERYKLTKETTQSTRKGGNAPVTEKAEDSPPYVTKGEYEALCEELKDIRRTVEELRREMENE